MLNNTIQYNTVQYNTIQYITIQYSGTDLAVQLAAHLFLEKVGVGTGGTVTRLAVVVVQLVGHTVPEQYDAIQYSKGQYNTLYLNNTVQIQ